LHDHFSVGKGNYDCPDARDLNLGSAAAEASSNDRQFRQSRLVVRYSEADNGRGRLSSTIAATVTTLTAAATRPAAAVVTRTIAIFAGVSSIQKRCSQQQNHAGD
jgi:hypothetical protein